MIRNVPLTAVQAAVYKALSSIIYVAIMSMTTARLLKMENL